MFERFTESARHVVVLAQEQARTLGHGYIGVEHLLIGVLAERERVGKPPPVGLALPDVVARIAAHAPATAREPSGHIPFTSGAKEVLERSLREALRAQHNFISTGHLLLAIVAVDEGGVTHQVFTDLEVDLDRVREQTISTLADEDEPAASSKRTSTTDRLRTLEAKVEQLTEEVAELKRRLGESA